MRWGLFDAAFKHLDRDAFLDFAVDLGCSTVEFATGNFVGSPHCDPGVLLSDAAARRALTDDLSRRGLTISALSCHGNPLHPDADIGNAHHAVWRDTLRLAEALEVSTVVAFSGLPGGATADVAPNWATCAWPTYHPKAAEWQWTERVLPYWEMETAIAETHGVRPAIEMHAGFAVHSPATALRLIHSVGRGIGVNFDPSHLFWQQIDPVRAANSLEGHILHVHGKDTLFDPDNLGRIGVLDTGPIDDWHDRAWYFCSVGDGHDAQAWQSIVKALAASGCTASFSLEHEDPRVLAEEGARRGAAFLRGLAS